MEIGSLSGMQQSSGMRPMRPPKGDPAEHAEKMAARIMEQQDTNDDGLLNTDELDGDSDLIAKLDQDGDGILSQTELQTGLQTAMEEGKAAFDSGGMPSEENRELMEKMRSMAGPPPEGMRPKATQAYGLMQEAMFGEGSNSYNTDQLLLESLNVTV